jgi:hypothetical protein
MPEYHVIVEDGTIVKDGEAFTGLPLDIPSNINAIHVFPDGTKRIEYVNGDETPDVPDTILKAIDETFTKAKETRERKIEEARKNPENLKQLLTVRKRDRLRKYYPEEESLELVLDALQETISGSAGEAVEKAKEMRDFVKALKVKYEDSLKSIEAGDISSPEEVEAVKFPKKGD